MPHAFWETIAATPWWFFLVLICLIYISLQARKPHAVSYFMLFTIPSILLIIGTFILIFVYKTSFFEIQIWLLSALVGIFLGWLQFWLLKIKAIRNQHMLYVPATWSLLVISLIVFAGLYFLGYKVSFDPMVLVQPTYIPILIGLYGLFTGIFFGRLIYALRAQKKGPFLD